MRPLRRGRRHISRNLSAFRNVCLATWDVTDDPMQPFTVGGVFGGGGIRVGHNESVKPAGLGAFEGYFGHVHGLEREEGRTRADLERVISEEDLDVWREAVQDIGDDACVLQGAGAGGLLDGSSHLCVREEGAVGCRLEGERSGGEEGKRCQEAWHALAEGDHVKLAGRLETEGGCCVVVGVGEGEGGVRVRFVVTERRQRQGATKAHLRTCMFCSTEHREHTQSTTRRHGNDARRTEQKKQRRLGRFEFSRAHGPIITSDGKVDLRNAV